LKLVDPFFAFFQICIQLKHKKHNILLLGSFSIFSSIAKGTTTTTINYNRRKNEYNKIEVLALLVMVGSKVPLPNYTQNHRKKGKLELPHIVAPISTQKKSKN